MLNKVRVLSLIKGCSPPGWILLQSGHSCSRCDSREPSDLIAMDLNYLIKVSSPPAENIFEVLGNPVLCLQSSADLLILRPSSAILICEPLSSNMRSFRVGQPLHLRAAFDLRRCNLTGRCSNQGCWLNLGRCLCHILLRGCCLWSNHLRGRCHLRGLHRRGKCLFRGFCNLGCCHLRGCCHHLGYWLSRDIWGLPPARGQRNPFRLSNGIGLCT